MDAEDELRDFVAARGLALSRSAYLLTGNKAAAEDLVQETYVVMVRRWRHIDHSNPEPYVRRIMYSRYVDGWRRSRLAVFPTANPPERSVAEDSPSAAVDRLVLSEALDRLTRKQRAVLVLRFYDDLTEVQTAEALRVSVNTVKSQTRVALQRLRELAPDLGEMFVGTTEGVAE